MTAYTDPGQSKDRGLIAPGACTSVVIDAHGWIAEHRGA